MSVRSAESVAAAAESVVLTAASAATRPKPTIASAEPGLKPYQPNQRMNTPRMASDALWPAMSLGCTHAHSVSEPLELHRTPTTKHRVARSGKGALGRRRRSGRRAGR